TLLKLGRGLAVGDVHILSDGILVARATLTYSRPRAVAG
ncbi:MAG: thioesterase, partial [Boseongicola sp.]|nr:thioesterase [Boseongicola sp.]